MSTSILYLPDYSGIEMRLIAEASGERELIDMFVNDPENADPHSIAATMFYDKIFTDKETCLDFFKEKNRSDEIYKKHKKVLRTAAKNASFAKAYIAKLPKLLKTLMLTQEQAEPGYNKYRERWPNVFYFSEKVMEEAKEKGYVETVFGSVLSAPEDQLYILGNYKIQNMAAKILKRGIVRCHQYYKEAFNGNVKIVLDIHDELVIKFPRKYLKREDEFIETTTELMTYCPEITIPLSVEWKMTTTNWAAAKKMEI